MNRTAADDLQTATAWGERGTIGPVFAGDISWDHISYAVGNKQILNDVSFSLKAGQVGCLLGPSGCGKSTLLRIAAGIARQTAGRIVLDDQEVAGPSVHLPAEKRSIGLMFQDFALFPHLTVLRNVMFGLYAVPVPEARQTAERALERVGLAHLANSYPHQLSGGEQQRVALARTIVPRPQVILMDEPFSGLDPQLRAKVRDETLALLRETRATSLIVTHDPEEALEIADVLVLMKNGGIAQLGKPEELYGNPATPEVARYFSALNETQTIVRAGAVDTPLGQFPAKGFAEGVRVLVMIRPSAVHLAGNEQGQAAQVLSVRRRGRDAVVQFQATGMDAPWTAHMDKAENIKTGDQIRVTADASGVLLFPSAQ